MAASISNVEDDNKPPIFLPENFGSRSSESEQSTPTKEFTKSQWQNYVSGRGDILQRRPWKSKYNTSHFVFFQTKKYK